MQDMTAKLIYENKNNITKVKYVLITDILLEKTLLILKLSMASKYQSVWDIERVFRFVTTGERETIEVDFTEYFISNMWLWNKKYYTQHIWSLRKVR